MPPKGDIIGKIQGKMVHMSILFLLRPKPKVLTSVVSPTFRCPTFCRYQQNRRRSRVQHCAAL